MEITFTVDGVPVAKARPRSRAFQVKGQVRSMMYTPAKSVNFENLVRLSFRQVHTGQPTEKPVKIWILAFFPVPQGWPKYRRVDANTDAIPVTKKPDIDNIVKSILDGLNAVAFQDDKQVYSISAKKFYSYTPRTVVTIRYPDD